ncbi:MAG: COG1470 family protein [Candidatus Limnocylindria bacterium]
MPTVPTHGRRRGAPLAAIGLLLSSTLALAPATAAAGVTLSTPYPSIEVAAGAKVAFDITILGAANEQVALSVTGVPADWTATLRGGGYVVNGVQTDATGKATVTLDLTVPGTAKDGVSTLSVTANAGGVGAVLPLAVQVNAAVSGDVTLTSDVPSLRGASGTTFTFNPTLHNDSAQDLTFAVNAVGPTGWEVTSTLTGQAQAASAVVQANGTSAVSVSAKAATDAAPGTYPIDVKATLGDRTIDAQLTVEVTGTTALTLSTPDQRLSNSGSAGSSISQQLVVTNDGTQPLQQVVMSATAPTDWTVTFSPSDTIATINAKDSATVTATIVPSNDAIAGDYVVTFTSRAADANGSVDIRMTIETSPLFGFVGLALIVLVLFGLYWVFQRYGRR